jgi:hypothetical protein
MASERRCPDCRRSLASVSWGPMLYDKVWKRIACDDELLCGDCIIAGAERHGVALTLDSLVPCPMNLDMGWFSHFAELEGATMSDEARRQWALAASGRGGGYPEFPARPKITSRCRCKPRRAILRHTTRICGWHPSRAPQCLTRSSGLIRARFRGGRLRNWGHFGLRRIPALRPVG